MVKLIEACAQLRPKALLRWAWHPEKKIRHAIRWYYRMGRRVWIHEMLDFWFRDTVRARGRTLAEFLGNPQDQEEEASAPAPRKARAAA
jgi:anaerobic magnesium-protoporphyrin IX monomethyl ester cyclase